MMNLTDRIVLLKQFDEKQTWYITRQDLTFWKLCYGVKILKEFQKGNSPLNFEKYYEKRVADFKELNKLELINTHRALNNAYYLGLLKKGGSQYVSASTTAVFDEITRLCSGKYEDVAKYKDLMEHQIEKLYFSLSFDEKYNDIRKQYRLFPVFTLYKILLLIGDITNNYSISLDEFFTFVCTTAKYEDFFETVKYIIESRSSNPNIKKDISSLSKKFASNIRVQMIIKQLHTLNVNDASISIKKDMINYVRERVYMFEIKDLKNLNIEDFLCKVDCIKEKDSIEDNVERGNNMIIESIPTNEVDVSVPKNLIVYGAPGTGKSHKLETEFREKFFPDDYLFSRVTFNANYSFADFVGVYKPTPIYVKSESSDEEFYSSNKVDKLDVQMKPIISYSFVPGPFLTMLCEALSDPNHNYLLLIEEINRADVAGVFGDVFQLLDRETEGDNTGCSEYGITFNKDVMDYIASMVSSNSKCFEKDSFVKIPSNLYIFATMNSADQNVNKMDTAFKRRWDFIYLGINETESEIDDAYISLKFLGKDIKWNDFRKALNKYLEETVEISEDKLIGPHFMGKPILNNSGTRIISDKSIKFKLFMYLREDVLRHNSSELFRENWSFGHLIETYDAGIQIFVDEFHKTLCEIAGV